MKSKFNMLFEEILNNSLIKESGKNGRFPKFILKEFFTNYWPEIKIKIIDIMNKDLAKFHEFELKNPNWKKMLSASKCDFVVETIQSFTEEEYLQQIKTYINTLFMRGTYHHDTPWGIFLPFSYLISCQHRTLWRNLDTQTRNMISNMGTQNYEQQVENLIKNQVQSDFNKINSDNTNEIKDCVNISLQLNDYVAMGTSNRISIGKIVKITPANITMQCTSGKKVSVNRTDCNWKILKLNNFDQIKQYIDQYIDDKN